MDPSPLRTTSGLPLDELVAHALSELDRVNYSRRAVRRYRTVWAKLVAFSRERNLENRYSEELAAEFVAAYSQQQHLLGRVRAHGGDVHGLPVQARTVRPQRRDLSVSRGD